MITIVGMGRNADDLTMRGAEEIRKADVVVVKSGLTHAAEAVAKIRSDAVYCDDLYQQSEDFDMLNSAIVARLQSYGNKRVAFCVVGDGIDDTAAQLLTDAEIICGVGLHSSVMPAVGGVRVYTASEICAEKYVLPLPTVVKSVDDKYVANEVSLKLLEAFDDDTELMFYDGTNVRKIALRDLPKQRFSYKTSVGIVPKKLTERQTFDYYDAAEVLAVLRAPNGCPWDREQTHKSILKNAVEEAYELVDALEQEDNPHIVEELGDVLMQVLFHLEIAKENGEFEPSAVYSGLCRKLIDRHPHVFGEVKTQNAEQALDVWNSQKLKEHKIKSVAQNVTDVPFGMSALLRCQKVQSRASKGGYDFSDVSQAVDKVKEELSELLEATESEREAEGGDLIFAAVNVLRLLGVDSETALLASTRKFVRRVVECERILSEQNLKLTEVSAEKFDEIWAEAKRNVG